MAVTSDRHALDVSPAGSKVVRGLARPTVLAVLCVLVLAITGWIYLGLTVAGMVPSGMGSVDASDRGIGGALIDALCGPSFGNPHAHLTASSGFSGPLDLGLAFIMWCAMALAMMLPTAGPMILTYAEISETAAHKGERAVSPLVLAAGYLSAWIGFAALATVLQWTLARAAWLDPGMIAAQGLFSGAVFILAGLYQFSGLKRVCVTLCQRPLPFFLANWTTRPGAVARLGLRQGIYCLGCCWAMMLVMFAVGVMNVVWMAILGVIMTLEKIATTTRFSRAVGAVLILIGIGFIAVAVATHWPDAG